MFGSMTVTCPIATFLSKVSIDSRCSNSKSVNHIYDHVLKCLWKSLMCNSFFDLYRQVNMCCEVRFHLCVWIFRTNSWLAAGVILSEASITSPVIAWTCFPNLWFQEVRMLLLSVHKTAKMVHSWDFLFSWSWKAQWEGKSENFELIENLLLLYFKPTKNLDDE